MVSLTEAQVRRLKVGDDVIYKERSGVLNTHHYKAKVTGVYPNFILLSCAANLDPNDSYEDANNYFNTCFCYNDGVDFGGYKLYKEY